MLLTFLFVLALGQALAVDQVMTLGEALATGPLTGEPIEFPDESYSVMCVAFDPRASDSRVVCFEFLDNECSCPKMCDCSGSQCTCVVDDTVLHCDCKERGQWTSCVCKNDDHRFLYEFLHRDISQSLSCVLN